MPKHKVQSAGELVRLRGSTHGLGRGCRVLTGLYRCCCARWKNTRGTEQRAKRAGVRPSSCCGAMLEGLCSQTTVSVLKATTAIALQRAVTWHAARARNKTVYVATEKK